MNRVTRTPAPPAKALLAPLCALALCLTLAGEARAQWATSPSNANNISNTNSGAVGVGTNNPGNYRLQIWGVNAPTDATVSVFNGTHGILFESQAGHKVGSLFNFWDSSGATGVSTRQVVALGYTNGPWANLVGFYSRQRVWHNYASAYGFHGVAEADTTGGPMGQVLVGGRFEAKTSDQVAGAGNVAYGVIARGTAAAQVNPHHSAYGVVAQATAAAGTHETVTTYALYADGSNSGAGRAYGVYSAAGANYFAGGVGVGTASPAYKLDVQGGQINASGGLCIAGDCRVSWSQVAGGSGATQWTTSGSNIHYNSGNVGVGTTSPASILSVNLNNADHTNAGGAGSHLLMTNPNASGQNVITSVINGATVAKWRTDYVGNVSAVAGGAGGHYFYTGGDYPGGAVRMAILNNGNVGIGTASPNSAFKLDVQGGKINASGGLCIAGDCKSSWAEAGGGASQWATSGSSIHYSSGSVGVGTNSPQQALTVSGYNSSGVGNTMQVVGTAGAGTPQNQLNITSAANTWGLILGQNNGGMAGAAYHCAGCAHVINYNNASLHLGTNNATRVIITGAGDVGIGTDTPKPSYKLDVNGAANVTGDLNATGKITGGVIEAKYQDVAEWVPSVQKLAAGTVVILDPSRSNHVLASASSYDTAVAGVVSAQPGLILGEGGEGKVMVATTGR
ncbi:MAG TPA: hypothetical protein VK421_02150, partial [Pyrinomonadaceae bacterium]|nr:hypothetical protein [Pyrinomonadaceae bacterium]